MSMISLLINGEKNPEHKSDGLLLKYLSLIALIEKLARLG